MVGTPPQDCAHEQNRLSGAGDEGGFARRGAAGGRRGKVCEVGGAGEEGGEAAGGAGEDSSPLRVLGVEVEGVWQDFGGGGLGGMFFLYSL